MNDYGEFETKFKQALRDMGVDFENQPPPKYPRQLDTIYALCRHISYYNQIKVLRNGDILTKVRTHNGQKGRYIINTHGNLIRQ